MKNCVWGQRDAKQFPLLQHQTYTWKSRADGLIFNHSWHTEKNSQTASWIFQFKCKNVKKKKKKKSFKMIQKINFQFNTEADVCCAI